MAANAQTTVSAGTLSSAHWTLSGSPYKITGHIIVANNDSLVIDPGVTVEFQGKYKLFCNGKILARGTAAQHILFTVPAANQNTGWLGIRFDNTPTSNGTSVFNYCTIEYGRADLTGDDKGGGFLFNSFSNCTISNSVIRNCYAQYGGGAVYGTSSSPTFSQDTFINNSAYNGGWGVDLTNSTSNIEKCLFRDAGIYCYASSLKITDNYFLKCQYEGGISSFSNVTNGFLEIYRNVFDSCSQENGGGGGAILLLNAQAKIERNIFKRNVSRSAGGAISCYTQLSYPNSGATVISNNLFYSNRAQRNMLAAAPFGGGAISFENCSGKVINNTIVNNLSDSVGGAIFCGNSSSPSFYNNIIFDNHADGASDNIFILYNSSDPNFYNNDLQGGFAGINTNGTPLTGANVGNINGSPVFTNAAAQNYALSSGSPCINAGTTAGITAMTPSLDLAGNSRISGTAIDMGAYESAGVVTPPTQVLYVNNSTALSLYPNPATHYFEITAHQLNNVRSVRVLDLTGKDLAHFDPALTNHFDVSNLPAGIFLIRVLYNDGSERVARITKQ
jgi:hypothetical protein